MAVVATEQIREQEYGCSTTCMEAAGRLAILGAQNSTEAGPIQQLKGEYYSAVFEGLASDAEHRAELRVTNFDTQEVEDDQVVITNEHGEKIPLIGLVEAGHEKAQEKAKLDTRMETEVQRTANDVNNAYEVNAMVAGQRDYNTRIVISCDPADAIKRDGAKHWKRVGYLEGLVYVQLYHDFGDGEIMTGSLSMWAQDKAKIRAALADYDIQIPEDESTDNYINYALTGTMSGLEAQELALGLRERCEDDPELAKTETVELLQENEAIMEAAFNRIYLPIGKSLVQGKKTTETAAMAAAYLARSANYSSEVRSHLDRINNSPEINRSDARLLHQLAVYSAIEMLRTAVTKEALPPSLAEISPQALMSGNYDFAALLNSWGRFGDLGASLGREYSGCGGGINLSKDPMNNSLLDNSPQEAFGGRCPRKPKNGDLVKSCPHCKKKNVKVSLEKTSASKEEIRCDNPKCVKVASHILREVRKNSKAQAKNPGLN